LVVKVKLCFLSNGARSGRVTSGHPTSDRGGPLSLPPDPALCMCRPMQPLLTWRALLACPPPPHTHSFPSCTPSPQAGLAAAAAAAAPPMHPCTAPPVPTTAGDELGGVGGATNVANLLAVGGIGGPVASPIPRDGDGSVRGACFVFRGEEEGAVFVGEGAIPGMVTAGHGRHICPCVAGVLRVGMGMRMGKGGAGPGHCV